jgi:hypothetical protein
VKTEQATEVSPLRSVFWPFHLLPDDIPDSRILSWGYDSKVSHYFDGSANKNDILAYSRNLLGDLDRERSDLYAL